MEEIAQAPKQRDEWEIKEDYRAVKRAMAIFKDKDRLEDVQKMIKDKKSDEKALDSIAEGDIKAALGL